MEERDWSNVERMRRREAEPQSTGGEGLDRRRWEDSTGALGSPEPPVGHNPESVVERIDSLGLRLGGEVGRLREAVEIYSLNLFSKAIEALSRMEADWVRAQSEVQSLREKLREATLGVGELQQQLDRIADLRRKAEAESAALRDDLQRELVQVRQELAGAREGQRIAIEQRDAAERECRQLQQRLSWRVLAPLRSVRSLFKSKG